MVKRCVPLTGTPTVCSWLLPLLRWFEASRADEFFLPGPRALDSFPLHSFPLWHSPRDVRGVFAVSGSLHLEAKNGAQKVKRSKMSAF